MKRTDVVLGKCYIAKVSGRLAVVRLLRESPYGGWEAVNEETGRAVHIKTAARLRRPATIRDTVPAAPVAALPDVFLGGAAGEDQ